MALISCPECNKRVSEKAPQCPNCGAPIATETVKPRPGRGESPAAEHKSFQLTKPTGGILGGLVAGVVKLIVVILIIAGLSVGVPALLKSTSQSSNKAEA